MLLSPAGCGWSAAAGVRAQKCGISLSGLPQEEVTAQRTLPELFLVLQEGIGSGGRLQEFDPVRGAFGHGRMPGHVRNIREILFMGEGRGFPAFTWHRPRPRADRRLFPACTRHFAGTRAAEAERHGHGGMKTAAAMMRVFPEKIFL